jgi:hypothetical protein
MMDGGVRRRAFWRRARGSCAIVAVVCWIPWSVEQSARSMLVYQRGLGVGVFK